MGIALKSLISAGTVGSISVGAGLTGYLLSGESIQDHLTKKGFTILKEKDSEWTTILASYKTAVENSSELKFGEFKGETENVAEFKKHCQELLSRKHQSPESSKDYKKAFWCVKEQTVSDYLKFERREALNTAYGEGTNNDKWDEKIKLYSGDPKIDKDKEIKDLALSGESKTKPTSGDRTNIKESCATLNKKKHYEKEFEKSKELAVLWCSDPIASDQS